MTTKEELIEGYREMADEHREWAEKVFPVAKEMGLKGKIRLTDAEIKLARFNNTGFDEMAQDRCVAKAQIKKMVDIIKRDCPETLFLLEDLKFWHELLEETK